MKRHTPTKSMPWFSAQVGKCIKEQDQAYSRWKRFKIAELFNTYKILRNKVNIVIKKDKTKFYENKFTKVIDSNKKMDCNS